MASSDSDLQGSPHPADPGTTIGETKNPRLPKGSNPMDHAAGFPFPCPLKGAKDLYMNLRGCHNPSSTTAGSVYGSVVSYIAPKTNV